MIDVLEHPLVADYLHDLDIALAGLPPAEAGELSAQIRAHLTEALPPDPDRDAVIAVLAALGPARLVAEATQPALPKVKVGSRARRAVAAFRRISLTNRLAIVTLVTAIALVTGAIIYWHAQPSLRQEYSFTWWNRADWHHIVETHAGDMTQITVTIRPGHLQGFAFFVYNPSNMTQYITGSADPVSLSAGVPPTVLVSTTGSLRVIGEARLLSYRLGGPIPPHSYRWVRVQWRSWHCLMNVAGGSDNNNTFSFFVRVGWITRKEVINLDSEIAVAATKASTRADAAYCARHPNAG
jgi:hypothetical protein